MTNKPRLRFAPSPTGYLHIGGARTALYNFLLARKWEGTFILRIEDTDLERSTPESIQAILDGMNWLGLSWDEGPFFQTKRFDIYHQHMDKLLSEGKAYPCFCPPHVLDEKRKLAMAEKRKPMYDRTCLKLTPAEIEEKKSNGETYCIRFKSPDEGEIVIEDAIKGPVVIANKELDDLIIGRSDKSPTYNFTVVVDDVTMGMTHVVRGDDHLNNTPRQIQLYQAFNYPLPIFAHVPMILGADKKRLSKRHGATSVMAYKEMGYLPEALINYLVRLGWSFKDQEVFTLQEMIQHFNLEQVSKAAGVFNPEKLLWLNGVYIRQSDPSYLAGLTRPFLEQRGLEVTDPALLIEAVKISQEKVKTLVEMAEMVDFLFVENTPDESLQEKHLGETAKPILQAILEKLSPLQAWNHDSIEAVFKEIAQEKNLKLGQVAQPARVALTGRTISAGLFDIIRLLGKEKTIHRIKKYT